MRFDGCLFPYHASRDCRVWWEHGSRIKCTGICTRDRRRRTLLCSRPIDSLDAISVLDGRWLSILYRFIEPCFRVRDHDRHHALVITYLCRSVELEPRFFCESSRCECWLGYPLLTSSTVAPEPLFEHLCSSRGCHRTDQIIRVQVQKRSSNNQVSKLEPI